MKSKRILWSIGAVLYGTSLVLGLLFKAALFQDAGAGTMAWILQVLVWTGWAGALAVAVGLEMNNDNGT